MSENRIVTATYDPSGRSVTEPVYKWNYGNVLKLEEFPEGFLTDVFEVHFSIGSGKSKTAIGTNAAVNIPNICLEKFGTVTAWLFLHDAENDGETRYEIGIPVIARDNLDDEEPTPIEESAITQAIAALNVGVTRAETAQAAAETAQGAAETAQENAEAAADRAEQAAETAAEDAIEAAKPILDGYKNAAESAAASAANSATDANASRSAADVSATAAGTSERNAKASETAAAGSASDAAGSARTAGTKATQASNYADYTSASASSAQASAETATTKAGEASQSASDASGYAAAAETAQGKAETAQGKAEDAQEAAEAAQTAAETAESNAEASETAAAASATAAAESATAAAGSASAASNVKDYLDENYASLSEDVSNLNSALTELEGKETADRKRIAYLYSLHMDGTAATYKKLMKQFFDTAGAEEMEPEALTALCSDWYAGIRGDWNGSTVFYQPDVSDVSTGTKAGDNADKVCVPSTDTVAGQDDYAGLPLFAPTDVNWEIDADTLDVVITGIDGITSGFERHNPDKLVGVMQMSGWHWRDENEETFIEGYSERYQAGHDYCKPVPEAVRVDNTMREFVVHAKYPGHVVDGKMRCYAGVIPTAWMSHNLLQTRSKANGNQYGAGSVLLQSWLILMTRLKYASLTQDGKIQGCLAYNYQYYAQVAETGVRRVILLPANAANIEIGSGVLIGTIQRSDTNIDRAYVNNITGQQGAIVTAKEDVEIDGTQYVAVYVNTENAFDTTGEGAKVLGATVLSTFHWPTGTNDAVLGYDGSITSNTDAKHPAKLQGIEYITGAYEVFGDVILEIHPADSEHEFGYISYHTVDRAVNQATSVTGNYKDSGIYFDKLASAGGWRYIMKMGFSDGLYAPEIGNGSSTKCTRDAFYENTELTALALREWLAFANLNHGSGGGGLSCLAGADAVSNAGWNIGGRPSACANRGVWGATPQ